MKPTFKYITLILFLLFVSACGQAPPEQGYVIDKTFEPAHWQDGYETYYVPEYRCNSYYDYNTKSYSQRCGTEMVPRQRYESHYRWIDDRWRLKLEDCKLKDNGERKCNRGWRTVDENTYNQYNIGEHYPNPK